MIREINKEDYEQIMVLDREFAIDYNRKKILKGLQYEYLQYVDIEKMIKKTVDEYFEIIPNPMMLVDEEEGIVVGFIQGEIEEKPGRIYSKVGYIKNWFVTEKYRGKGIGQKLMEEEIKYFKSQNIKLINLEAFTQNLPSLEIYKHLGFKDLSVEMIKKI